MKAKKDNPGDLLQGTLDMLILKSLVRGQKHGYAVAEWIHLTSDDVLRVEEGALYPALHRLELRGLLSSGWGASDNPDCSGFSLAQLQSLDFSRMDLSEFYAEIAPTLPNASTYVGNASSKIPSCYFGNGKC